MLLWFFASVNLHYHPDVFKSVVSLLLSSLAFYSHMFRQYVTQLHNVIGQQSIGLSVEPFDLLMSRTAGLLRDGYTVNAHSKVCLRK